MFFPPNLKSALKKINGGSDSKNLTVKPSSESLEHTGTNMTAFLRTCTGKKCNAQSCKLHGKASPPKYIGSNHKSKLNQTVTSENPQGKLVLSFDQNDFI